MCRSNMKPESRARAEALTQEKDERDYDYWAKLICKDGWVLHYEDEHHHGRWHPHALAVIDIFHMQGCDWFRAPLHGEGNILDYAVTVFSDEITTPRTKIPWNRQLDGNAYVYKLRPREHYFNDYRFKPEDYTDLPTGMYKLEIIIPLFKLEKVVSIWGDLTYGPYRASTSEYVYDETEIEKNEGFMGLVEPCPHRGEYYIWKLIRKAVNIDQFYLEMHRRSLAMNLNYQDTYTGFATDNARPTHDDQEQSSLNSDSETVDGQTEDAEETEWEMTDAEDEDDMGEDDDTDDDNDGIDTPVDGGSESSTRKRIYVWRNGLPMGY